MTGRPKLAVCARKIASLGGEEWVLDQIRAGTTRTAIARDLGVTRGLFYTWVKSVKGFVDRMKEADIIGAEAVFDHSTEVLEELAGQTDLMPVDVQLARARSDNAMKRAAALDPDRFSPKKEAATLNITMDKVYLEGLVSASQRA